VAKKQIHLIDFFFRINHSTNKEERHRVLEKFNSGVYHAVVTSKVLDDGIDVPPLTGFVID
jgi:superfamily II DNA or RNA helicase